jgi:hypothetical protein
MLAGLTLNLFDFNKLKCYKILREIIMKRLGLLIITIFLMLGCSDGSKLKGKVEDRITGKPLSGITISALTKTDIEEDKGSSSKSAQSQSNGEFVIKGLSPEQTYTIVASKTGYSEDRATVQTLEKGVTKEMESPLRIYELPPSEGVFIKTGDGFTKLVYTATYPVTFYSKSTQQAIAVYYVLEELVDQKKFLKVKNGDFIFMNIGPSSWYVTPLNRLSVEAGAEKDFEAPNENYNYKGQFPKGLYCGLSKLDKNTSQPESNSIDIGMGPYIQINLPKGMYILTTSRFRHWTPTADSPTKYSPKSGWLFEVE